MSAFLSVGEQIRRVGTLVIRKRCALIPNSGPSSTGGSVARPTLEREAQSEGIAQSRCCWEVEDMAAVDRRVGGASSILNL